jgi:hypothetical protein
VDGLTSSCKIPPLLHTCSRARELALQRWRLCFPITSELEGKPGSEEDDGRREAKIFFDYESDTLFFTQEFVDICQFSDMVSELERFKIRSVAWDLNVLSVMFDGAKFYRTLSREFDKNIRFTFVLRCHEVVWGRKGKMIGFSPASDPRASERWRREEWRECAFLEACFSFSCNIENFEREIDRPLLKKRHGCHPPARNHSR